MVEPTAGQAHSPGSSSGSRASSLSSAETWPGTGRSPFTAPASPLLGLFSLADSSPDSPPAESSPASCSSLSSAQPSSAAFLPPSWRARSSPSSPARLAPARFPRAPFAPMKASLRRVYRNALPGVDRPCGIGLPGGAGCGSHRPPPKGARAGTRAARLLDQPLFLGLQRPAVLEPLEALAGGGGADALAAAREDLGDLLPGETLVNAQGEQGLVLDREGTPQRLEPPRLPLHPEEGAAADLGGDRRGFPGAEAPDPAAPGRVADVDGGVGGEAQRPDAQAALEAEETQAAPQAFGPVRVRVGGVGLVPQRGPQVPQHLRAEAAYGHPGRLAELAPGDQPPNPLLERFPRPCAPAPAPTGLRSRVPAPRRGAPGVEGR